MAKQAVFLEEWLKDVSGYNGGASKVSSSQNRFASPARAIIQSWAELRDSLKTLTFGSHHLLALKSLVDSQPALHVADPQAKLVLSVISAPELSLPYEAYPLLLRLLYIWARKSARPSSSLVDMVVGTFSDHVAPLFGRSGSPRLVSEAVLLLGSLAFVGSASESSKRVCLEWMCRILDDKYRTAVAVSSEGTVPDVFAGIGYALSSSLNFHYAKMLDFLLGEWPGGDLFLGIMILHLFEWVTSCLIAARFVDNIVILSREALESGDRNCVPCSLVMAAAGVLRTLNKFPANSPRGGGREDDSTLSRLRISAEERMVSVARDLISSGDGLTSSGLSLQCFSIALGRCGPVSPRPPFFLVLSRALLMEVFPLKRFHNRILGSVNGSSIEHFGKEVKDHLGSPLFKEAGTITSVFCDQYNSLDDENVSVVEDLIWDYCNHIYMEYRKVAVSLRGFKDELFSDMEKISESAFLMVVVFASSVTKKKLNSKSSNETRAKVSIRILVAFSCLEYFRRIRLPEYMDTIREVVLSIQENDASCISFAETIPKYADLTDGRDLSLRSQTKYVWYKDEVQTARILFYLRVIATCIERMPSTVFGNLLAPIMFLYLGHPNGKVARASHSMFVAFISSEKDSDQEERTLMKEQLVFYYIERSLSGYPGITPFESMASGVSALVRHLPAGSPAIFYCIHCLIDKAKSLCLKEDPLRHNDSWKSWQGELESGKKILDLLLRLVSLVDIQVLPELMKRLAQFIVELPKDGQIMVLNELYSIVAESDDVTRKPTLVSWLQSISYLCFQQKNANVAGLNARL